MSFDARDFDSEDLSLSAEINVTPFIDVMLVLLIIFMVTAPLLAQGMKVDLPKASASKPLDTTKAVTITLAAHGQIHVGEQQVESSGLLQAVRARLADDLSPIRIRADRETRYADVMHVIDTLTAAGLTRVTFVTFPQAAAKSQR